MPTPTRKACTPEKPPRRAPRPLPITLETTATRSRASRKPNDCPPIDRALACSPMLTKNTGTKTVEAMVRIFASVLSRRGRQRREAQPPGETGQDHVEEDLGDDDGHGSWSACTSGQCQEDR